MERLDNRLGFLQKELELSVKKTRDLVIRPPRLLTGRSGACEGKYEGFSAGTRFSAE